MLIKDFLPIEVQHGEYENDKVQKYLDYPIEKIYQLNNTNLTPSQFGFKHKNIFVWATFKDGNKLKAVGFNENPSIGWSFPIVLIKRLD